MSNCKQALALSLILGAAFLVAGRDATARSIGPAPVAPQQGDPAQFVVIVEPRELDMGEIATGDSASKTIKLINTADKAMTLIRAQPSCGCTALDIAPNTVLGPKEVREVKVQLQGGVTPGPLYGKKITFIVDGQPEIELPIKAMAVAFVTQQPATMSPEQNPDGKITLRSRDGAKFRILSMQPPMTGEFPSEAKTEHEIKIDWAKYREGGAGRKIVFYFDHPKCQNLVANIQVPADWAPPAPPAAGGDATAAPAPDPIAQLIQSKQNADLLKKIKDEGLDVNRRDTQGISLLSLAAKYGNVELITSLIDLKADIESTDNAGRTPLMHAACSKNATAVHMLLEHKANVKTRDAMGGSALSWAAGSGDPASVKELLDAGSDLEVAGRITGWTPLIWAAGFGESGSVQLLIRAGAKVDVADALEGATPLIHAARTGQLESVSALLKAGAKLEQADFNGCTPLLSAAKNSGGDAAKVKALKDAGANVHARDKRGLNALQLARKRTDVRAPEVLQILEPLLVAETPADAAAPANAETIVPQVRPAGPTNPPGAGGH